MSDLKLFPEQPIRAIDGRVVPQTPTTSAATGDTSPLQGGSPLDALAPGRKRYPAMQLVHRPTSARQLQTRAAMQRRLYLGRLTTR